MADALPQGLPPLPPGAVLDPLPAAHQGSSLPPLPPGAKLDPLPGESGDVGTPAGMAKALAEGKGDMPSFGDVKGSVATTAKPKGPTSVTSSTQSGGDTTQQPPTTPGFWDRAKQLASEVDSDNSAIPQKIANSIKPTEHAFAQTKLSDVSPKKLGVALFHGGAGEIGAGIEKAGGEGLQLAGRALDVGLTPEHAIQQMESGDLSKPLPSGNVLTSAGESLGEQGEYTEDYWNDWAKRNGVDPAKLNAWGANASVAGVVDLVANQASQMLLMHGAGAVSSKAAIGYISKANPKLLAAAVDGVPAAQEAVNRIATMANTYTVGTVASIYQGGLAGSEVHESVMHMTPEQLQKSPEYRDMIAGGADPVEAQKDVAAKAAARAQIGAYIATFLSPFAGAKAESMLGGKGASMAEGAITNSLMQGGSKISQNYGEKLADPDQEIFQGVVPTMVVGAGVGGVIGGIAGHSEKKAAGRSEAEEQGAKNKIAAVDLAAKAKALVAQDRGGPEADEQLKKSDLIRRRLEEGKLDRAAKLAETEIPSPTKGKGPDADASEAFKESINDTIKKYLFTPNQNGNDDNKLRNVAKLQRWRQQEGGRTPQEALVAARYLAENDKLPPEIDEQASADLNHDGTLSTKALMDDMEAHPELSILHVRVDSSNRDAIISSLHQSGVNPYVTPTGDVAILGDEAVLQPVQEAIAKNFKGTKVTITENTYGQQVARSAAAENEQPGQGSGEGDEADQVGPAADEGAKPATGEERPASQVATPRSQPVIDKLGKEGVSADVKGNGRVVVAPNETDSEQAIKIAANDAAESPENERREPTPAQKAQGNYPKGRIMFASPKGNIPVDIENPAGSIRKSLPGAKPAWSRKMTEHYGNIPGTYSADGEPVDVIVGRKSHDDNLPIFVMQQTAKDGSFDEHKVVMGARSEREARDMYLKQYPASMHDELLQGQTKMVRFNRPQFMDWMKSGEHDVPIHPMSKQPLLKLRDSNGRLDGYFKTGTDHGKLEDIAGKLNDKFGTSLEVVPEGAGYRLSGDVPKAKVPAIHRSLQRQDGHEQTEFNGKPAGEVYPQPSEGNVRPVRAQPAVGKVDRGISGKPDEGEPHGDLSSRPGRSGSREGVSGNQEAPRPPRWLKKVKTDAPVYAKGKGKNPVSVVGVNYSTTPGLKALDTAFAGTGSPGSEVRRFGLGKPKTQDNHRMYFYVRQSNDLPVKEPVVTGNHAYEARLDNLYDIHADPDGIMDRLDRKGTHTADAREAAIKGAGYDGFVTKGVANDTPVVQLIGPHKVPVKEVSPRYSVAPKDEGPEKNLYKKLGVADEGEITDRKAFDSAVGEYKKLPDSFGGRVVSGDTAKELSPEYLKDRTLAGEVHNPSSSFAKAYYHELLGKPHGENPTVLFMAGGTGAGKTTMVRQMEATGETLPDIIYDTNTAHVGSSVEKIDAALASGRKVRIGYVYRDPVDAFINGAVKRTLTQKEKFGSGRTVPMNAHVETHIGSLETFKALRAKYAGNDNVDFKLFNNQKGRPFESVGVDSLDNITESRHNIGTKISYALDDLYREGHIDESTYRGYKQVSADDPALDQAGPEGDRSGAQGSKGAADERASEGRINEVTQLSWEAVPSTKLARYRWITDMPTGMRSDYTREVNGAIGDMILDAHGLNGSARIGYGGWEGGINPSVQVRLKDAPEADVRAAAADYGYATRQDGVAYHKAVYDAKPEELNGTDIDIGRPLSATETKAIYDRVTSELEKSGMSKEEAQQVAPVPTPTGVRFLNFTDAPHQQVYDAVNEATDLLGSRAKIGRFRSDGDLITNDWKENPDGQGYRSGRTAAGSSDLQGGVADRARALVDGITERYRQEAIRQGLPARTAEESAAHVKEVQGHVDALRSTWKGAPETTVVASAKDLPQAVAGHLETSLGPDSGAEGVYYGGKVYLIGDSIRDKAHAEFVTTHETLGHYGLHATFGDELDNLLNEVHDSIKDTPEFGRVAQLYDKAYAGMDAREKANALTEEYLSDRATLQAKPSILSKVTAWFRKWARKYGLTSRWTDNDILNLMDGVARNVREGRASRQGWAGETATYGQDLVTRQSYSGAAGEGQIEHRLDGSRQVQVGDLKADVDRIVTEAGNGMLVTKVAYQNPADLLALTRLAGEEAKGYVLWPAKEEASLKAAGVPTERVGQYVQTPASRLDNQPARYSIRNQPEDKALADRINRVMGIPESSLSPWDRLQHWARRVAGQDNKVDRFVQANVDQFRSFAKAEMKINPKGTLLDASESAYKMSWMAQNTREVMGAVMHLGAPDYVDGSFVPVAGRKGLVDILSPLYQHPTKGFDRMWEFYAMARRSDQLQHMVNPDGTSKEKLLTPDDIKVGLELGEKYPVMKQVFADWQSFNHDLLDLAVKRGNMTPEMADLWKKNDYVPFYRVDEDGDGLNPHGQMPGGLKVSSKRLYGSNRQIEPLIENIIGNASTILRKVYKNEAFRRAAAVGQMAGTVERMPMGYKPVDMPVSEIEAKLEKMGMFIGQQANAQRGAKLQITPAQQDMWTKFFRAQAPMGDDVFSVMENGKAVYYKSTDDLFHNSINSLKKQEQVANWWKIIMGGPKNFFTHVLTLNPAFMLRHLERQITHTFVQSGENFNPFSHAISNAHDAYTNSDFMQRMSMAGAGGNEYYDIDQMREALRGMGTHSTILDTGHKVWMAYRKIGFVADQMNRMGIAKSVLERGGSTAEAAWQAQDLLNFRMHGNSVLSRYLVSAVPLLNARVQGLYRISRGASGTDQSYRSRKAAVLSFAIKGAMLVAASQALAIHNNGDPRFERLPDEMKSNYWHIFLGNMHFAIAKPFEIGALFATLPDSAARYVEGLDGSHTLKQNLMRVFENVFRLDFNPALTTPVTEDATNFDIYTQRPIVPETMQRVAPEAQENPFTSPSIAGMAHHMPEFMPDALRSPLRLQHLINGYMPGLGAYVIEAADAASRAAGFAPKAPMPRSNLPGGQATEDVLGSMVGRADTDPRNRYVNMVYEDKKKLDEIVNTIKDYKKKGDTESLNRYLLQHKTSFQYDNEIRGLYKAMDAFNTQEKFIYSSRTMTPEQKRDALNRITKERNDLLDKVSPILVKADSDLF